MRTSTTEGRTVVLAGAPGVLKDQVAACLRALGRQSILLELDGESGPEVGDLKEEGRLELVGQDDLRVDNAEVADLKEEARLGPALDRVAAACGTADAIVFVGRDLRDGEDVAEFIEEGIASYHFYLKLAKRLRVNRAMDLVALAGASVLGKDAAGSARPRKSDPLSLGGAAAIGEDAALVADIRNGSLRQMNKVAASEGGPLEPPLLVNTVYVSGEPRIEVSDSLKALLAHLLARPQGYITGTELRVRL